MVLVRPRNALPSSAAHAPLVCHRSAQQSYTRGLPISQFSKLPALANTIDADWRFKDTVYRPGGAEQAPDGVTENELYSA